MPAKIPVAKRIKITTSTAASTAPSASELFDLTCEPNDADLPKMQRSIKTSIEEYIVNKVLKDFEDDLRHEIARKTHIRLFRSPRRKNAKCRLCNSRRPLQLLRYCDRGVLWRQDDGRTQATPYALWANEGARTLSRQKNKVHY